MGANKTPIPPPPLKRYNLANNRQIAILYEAAELARWPCGKNKTNGWKHNRDYNSPAALFGWGA